MRRRTFQAAVILSVVAFVATLLDGASASAQVTPPRAATTLAHPAASPAFMHVCGLQFCIGTSPFYPYGASIYESSPLAGIDNPAGAIALAKSQHLNTIRLSNFLDHNGKPATAPFDATQWAKADAFIAAAGAAGIKILLDLSDYKAELWNSCTNPYVPGKWTNYLKFAGNRVNTVTGVPYASDPTIVLVTFTGEPLQPGSYKYTTSSGRTCRVRYTSAQLTTFYAKVEALWKTLDTNHLTSAGGLSYVDLPNNTIDWKTIFANPANDVCAWKTYGDMPTWLPTGASYCNTVLHKPWFNDEWGYTQAMGDGPRAFVFALQFANNANNGAAGNFFWNSNYALGAGNYDVGPGTPMTQAQVVANAH